MIKLENLNIDSFDEISKDEYATVNGGSSGYEYISTGGYLELAN